MKTQATTLITLSFLAIVSLRADDAKKTALDSTPPATWATLEKQARDLAADVQAQDVHPIHQIDHAIADETSALQKSEPTLAADKKTKLDALLEDMAKQVHRARLDGHAAKWDDATAAQKQFAADIKEAEVILPSAK